jgi:hypothetical protein
MRGNVGVHVVAALGELGASELLEVLERPDADRAARCKKWRRGYLAG